MRRIDRTEGANIQFFSGINIEALRKIPSTWDGIGAHDDPRHHLAGNGTGQLDKSPRVGAAQLGAPAAVGVTLE
ncbi:hypothetical protein, partial [Asaia sp. SF2.1]|uniref:hypothetical protein n=1 Tax=Asaia sp. SF2.1 TaxID=406101 RepID=UPI001F392E84